MFNIVGQKVVAINYKHKIWIFKIKPISWKPQLTSASNTKNSMIIQYHTLLSKLLCLYAHTIVSHTYMYLKDYNIMLKVYNTYKTKLYITATKLDQLLGSQAVTKNSCLTNCHYCLPLSFLTNHCIHSDKFLYKEYTVGY